MSRTSVRATVVALSLSVVAPLALAQPLPTARPEQVGMSSERLARIAPLLKQEIEAGRLPGAVVMIARTGKLVYSEAIGFQDKAAGTPMKSDAVFRIYSMTKPLVSVAAGFAYGEITQNAPVRDAYAKAGLFQQGVRDYDARDLTPTEFVERLCKAPLAQQPGTMWEYSLSVDMLGRVVEATSGQRLADFIEQHIAKPLKMVDTGFWVPKEKLGRLAQPLPVDAATGAKTNVIDVSAKPNNDSGGAGGVSTASDYLRFAQAMLNGGQLDGQRVLSRTTVALMTSDHLGARIATPTQPGELLMGTLGYTFGLGFMVRQGAGIAGVPGSQGEFMWAGYAGTFFWVDPKEELAVVYMTQAPSPIRPMYRRLMKQLTYQAIVD